MSKIIKAKYKASRRLGVSIWGDSKDPVHKKNYRPGQHGLSGAMIKSSDYGIHLKAKQRIKSHYGRINERQFRNIFDLASKMKGNTGENFIGLLECRLDAIVYRMNLSASIFGARQLVSHGHILVNGKKLNIPSARLKEGDVVTLKEGSRNITPIMESVSKMERTVPDYLQFDPNDFSGKFVRTPTVSDVPFPFEAEVHMVVELYSR
ncbi:MAG UNVERIFIED_CONTAM: 30S ribosomal protein S4 [Rickettsiaceae bacterium]